jgi:methionine-gamma-lyase
MSERKEQKRGIATRAVHARSTTDGAPGEPVVAPIVPSTTFAFETAEEFGRVMRDEEYGFLYSRLRNPTVEDVNAVCAELEGAEAAQAFASGMAAIAAALHVTLRPGDTLLAAAQLYGNTYSLMERHIRRLGVDVVYADAADPGEWERPAHVRYVETIANPGFPVADLGGIASTKGNGVLIVDNTFASPVLCRPLEHGADVVVHSATKYLNGHHDVTAGVLCATRELVERARAHLIDTGPVLDPFPAFLLRRGLKTLAVRVERQCRNALAVARFLAEHGKVERVHYLGLEDHPQHELAARQLDGFGGVLAFEVAGGRGAGERAMNAVELCSRATSLGGVETVISHPASTSHRQFTSDQLASAGVSEGLLRLAVGCEDGDDIIADLDAALARA